VLRLELELLSRATEMSVGVDNVTQWFLLLDSESLIEFLWPLEVEE